MNIPNLAVAAFVVFVFGISLLNPGGTFVAATIALLVVAVVALVPFAQEYVLSVNKGKKARKKPDMSNQNDSGGRE